MKSQIKSTCKPLARFLLVFLLAMSSLAILPVKGQGTLQPESVAISGSISDNYVNITYELFFDNTGSAEDAEIDWGFGIQNNILLSNLSIIMGNKTYWGVVKPVVQAEQEYNASVERNETAVLMKQIEIGYSLQLNLEAGATARIFITLEGVLTRRLGGYSLSLPLSLSQSLLSHLTIDLAILSNFNSLVSYGIKGLSGLSYTALPNGMHIGFDSGSAILIPDDLGVMYRIADQSGGSQLITYTNSTDNFFAYLLAPVVSESTATARQVVFVLDTSGSMSGTPLAQAKDAFADIISSLNTDDQFNVIEFNSVANALWAENRPATGANIEAGVDWVSDRISGGSTNFYGGAEMGLNSFIDNDLPKIMLILSDGQPNEGTYTSPATIGPAIREANTLGVSISTIAFTDSVNLDFMGGIASDNNGYFSYITPDADSSIEIFDFYATLSVQGLQEYSIAISGATDFAHFRPIPDGFLVNGSEILITGRYASQIAFNTSLQYEEMTENYYNNETTPGMEYEHLETLWAQQRISYLLYQINLGNSEYEDEVVRLGMYYGLVIRGYTAMIITTEDEETPMENEDWYDDGALAGGMFIPGYPTSIFVVISSIMLGIAMKNFSRKYRK